MFEMLKASGFVEADDELAVGSDVPAAPAPAVRLEASPADVEEKAVSRASSSTMSLPALTLPLSSPLPFLSVFAAASSAAATYVHRQTDRQTSQPPATTTWAWGRGARTRFAPSNSFLSRSSLARCSLSCSAFFASSLLILSRSALRMYFLAGGASLTVPLPFPLSSVLRFVAISALRKSMSDMRR